MLVLSRKRDERIVIGEGPNQAVITIVAVRGDTVKVGIEAPKSLPVHRQEVYEAIHDGKPKPIGDVLVEHLRERKGPAA